MSDKPVTPGQIGSITGVDRMDSIDRAKLPAEVKFHLLCDEARSTHGRDPRGGGFAIVGRPRVILQVMQDSGVRSSMISPLIRLQRAVVVSTSLGKRGETVGEADIVGWWQDIPIAVRSAAVGDNLYVVPLDKIPASHHVDRVRAGELRMAAHYGKLHTLRDS
jgi:hypothetical protein